jgi:hypothetical protein
MEKLRTLIGKENGVDAIARALYEFARRRDAPLAGALHLTCSDESELECAEALRRSFSDHLLPVLKKGERSCFRLANLGARYEWGAAAIAEDHYATGPARRSFKLMLVKINSHVCVDRGAGGPCFGRMQRYDSESAFCGALNHLLEGGGLPCAAELAELFSSEGRDRLGALRAADRSTAETTRLFAAVLNARLQARSAMADIGDRRPKSPTLFLVLPCVTLNRRDRDTELVCGLYRADWRGDTLQADYTGLGDDPERYRLTEENGRLRVADADGFATRPARDHRETVLRVWLERQGLLSGEDAEAEDPASLVPSLTRDEAPDDAAADPAVALKRRLVELARRDPVPAAILSFRSGLAAIHHLYRAHRLARGQAGESSARRILREIHDSVDGMSAEQASEALSRISG